MKRGLLALLAALTITLLTACGGGMSGGDSASMSEMGTGGGDGPSADGGLYDYNGVMEPEAPMDLQAEEGETDRLENAKMIYTARLEVETTDFPVCAAALEELAAELGGYLESASVNSYNSGYRTGYYTVRVPSKQFQPFLKTVGEIGHVVYQEKDSQNISESYYDTESRLTTQRTKLERLQALLAQAENMEDLITIESAIAETELAIEQLTGELRHYDALVDYATIEVSLSEVTRLSNVEEAPPGFGSRLGTAFAGGLDSFGDFVQNLAIALAYSWIWLLILAACVVLAVRGLRKRAAKRPPFGSYPPGEEKPHDKQP